MPFTIFKCHNLTMLLISNNLYGLLMNQLEAYHWLSLRGDKDCWIMVSNQGPHMVWHDTQHHVLSGVGEMAALQWHHPQSHSTFWMPCALSTPGSTHQHQEIGRAGKNTSALIHMRVFLTHKGQVHGLTLKTVDYHPMTLTSTPSINQTHPLSLSFNPLSTHPGLRP